MKNSREMTVGGGRQVMKSFFFKIVGITLCLYNDG